MAQTHIQQHQISGSLASDISDNVERNNLVKVGRTIVDDLNSLRSQVKGILGSSAWTDEQAVSLSQLHASLVVDGANAGIEGDFHVSGSAAFDGTLSVAGEATLASAIVSDLTQTRVVFAGADGALVDDAAFTFSSGQLNVGTSDQGGSLSLKNSSDSEVIKLDAQNRSMRIDNGSISVAAWGSDGLDTSILIQPGNPLQSTNATIQVGYAGGRGGNVSVFDGSGNNIAGISYGGLYINASDGTTPKAQIDPNGLAQLFGADYGVSTVTLSGADASITVGANGGAGSVSVRNASNVEKIALDGATGNINVAGEATLASAIVSDLTESRVVFAGADGALVDDAALTFASNTLKVGAAGANGSISVMGENDVKLMEFNGTDKSLIFRNSDGFATIFANSDSRQFKILDAGIDFAIFEGDTHIQWLSDNANNPAFELNAGERLLRLYDASGIASSPKIILNANNGNAEFSGDVSVTGESTLASAIVSDLTETRVVFAGTDGALVDSTALTFASNALTVGAPGANGTIKLDGESGSFEIHQPDDTTTTSFTNDGQLFLGTQGAAGYYGRIAINGGNDGTALEFNGMNATITAGGTDLFSGVSGVVRVRDNTATDRVVLDGATGNINAAGEATLASAIVSDLTETRVVFAGASGALVDSAALTFDGSELAVDGDFAVTGDAVIAGNIQVDGDLRVKGSMTYIDTVNVRVEDAFIYLATGSLGTTDSGIVLHGGAGEDMDLAIAQKGGAGEFIFGKGNRAPDGEGALEGMVLVPAKLSEIKLGSAEDALSGSMSIAGNDVKLAASAAAIVFDDAYRSSSTYSAPIKLAASAAEWTAFQTQYPGKSLLGALGAGGGVGVNFRKKIIMGSNANFSGNTLDIAAAGIGSLRSTAQADADYGLDVYLNGVLLSLGAGADYTVPSVSQISFNYAINSDDVLTVVAKNIASA